MPSLFFMIIIEKGARDSRSNDLENVKEMIRIIDNVDSIKPGMRPMITGFQVQAEFSLELPNISLKTSTDHREYEY